MSMSRRLPLTQGDLGEGGKLFRVYCASCHRTAVRGGALAFTGRNAPALTNKSICDHGFPSAVGVAARAHGVGVGRLSAPASGEQASGEAMRKMS